MCDYYTGDNNDDHASMCLSPASLFLFIMKSVVEQVIKRGMTLSLPFLGGIRNTPTNNKIYASGPIRAGVKLARSGFSVGLKMANCCRASARERTNNALRGGKNTAQGSLRRNGRHE